MDFVDIDVFDSLKSFPKNRYEKLLLGFIDGSDKYISSIKKAIETEDIKVINFSVHSLKSSASLLGFASLSNLCDSVEEETYNGDCNILNIEGDLIKIYALYDEIRAFVVNEIEKIKTN